MPTTRPRHVLTETDDLARALDLAAEFHPGESRSALLRRLALMGAETLTEHQEQHLVAVRERAGRHRGVYPTGHLADLRRDWPE